MGTIKHAFTSPVTDTGDPDLVGPDEWNDDHDVTLDATDVGADPAGTAASEVATHTGDTTDAHDASAISVDSTNLAGTSTTVQGALEELDDAIVASTHDAATEGTGIDISGQVISVDLSELSAGGELAGTLDAPTVDTTHSGSSHTGAAADAVSTHEAASDPHTGYLKESDFTGVDFLVGTATGITGSEIAVGTTPGGELGNTWASPTVDVTHSGSSHASIQSAAEATAASALSTHESDKTSVHGFTNTDDVARIAGEITGTGASPTIASTHSGSAHHSAVTIGADTEHSLSGQVLSGVDASTTQKGHVTIGSTAPPAVSTAGAAGAASTEAASKNHVHAHEAQHIDHDTLWAAKGDIVAGTANDTAAVVSAGANGQMLTAQSGQTAGLQWANVFTKVEFAKSGNLSTSTGAFRWYNDTGRTLTFSKVRASAGTAPASQSILCDVNVDGTTIWSTQANRVAVAAAANTGTQTSFDTTTIADGHYITVDVDQVGSGTVGADLVVTVWMTG